MKSTKKASKAKAAAAKTTRAATKARKPTVSKAKRAKPAKAAASKSPRAASQLAKSVPAPPAVKPVHEWAEAIKKAALQNKQGHNSWPGAGTPSWKGKQRPE